MSVFEPQGPPEVRRQVVKIRSDSDPASEGPGLTFRNLFDLFFLLYARDESGKMGFGV